MTINFSQDLYDILQHAGNEALRTGHTLVGVDHIMLGALRHGRNSACTLLRSLGIRLEELKDYIDSMVFRDEGLPYAAAENIRLHRKAAELLCISSYEALKAGYTVVHPLHMMLAISRCRDNNTSEYLYEHGLDYDIILDYCSSKGLLMAEKPASPDQTKKVLGALADIIARSYNPEDSSKIYPC